MLKFYLDLHMMYISIQILKLNALMIICLVIPQNRMWNRIFAWNARTRWDQTKPQYCSGFHFSISRCRQSSPQKECLTPQFPPILIFVPWYLHLKVHEHCPRKRRWRPFTNRFWVPISLEARAKGRRTIKGGREERKTNVKWRRKKLKSGKCKGGDQQVI